MALRASGAGRLSRSRVLNCDDNVGEDGREGNNNAATLAEQDGDGTDSEAEVDGVKDVVEGLRWVGPEEKVCKLARPLPIGLDMF